MWDSVAQKAMEPQDVHVFQGNAISSMVEQKNLTLLVAGSIPVLFIMNAKSHPR